MITLIKVLRSIIYAAGYLAIVALASVISYNGRPAAGLGIILTLAAVSATLLVASAVVNRRYKRAVHSAPNADTTAAAGPTKTYSAHVSESYEHDARTVWSLIRPAESAVLLSNAQRAFTVPGTPVGVGEQQCFIRRDGSVSIIEVIGEESPWWATTRPILSGEMNSRSTYRLEPTSTGCTLTLGTVIELPADEVLAEDPDQWWETQMRPYLTRIKEVLAAGQT
ncbi:hypothetical protein ACFVWT_13855 [Arthrobacter sp. NPDC058288]|uniref:hypothetical protein n=1 Tax=Arthrobacter sp. NPDC058288 TaxID=3346424 RepID=UPI0036EF5A38